MTAAGRALVRAVPSSFARLYGPPNDPTFLETARRQHDRYVACLAASGREVDRLPADEAFPDCPFVEDTAVFLGATAVMVGRFGRADRRGEEDGTAPRLPVEDREVVRVEPPATLEGGDVLQVGGRVYVGRSARTNAAGVQLLADTCRRHGKTLTVVPVDRCLHLKTGCSAFSPDGVLWAPSALPNLCFPPSIEVIEVPDEETYAANCLDLGDRVLLAAGHLRTAAALDRRGRAVTLLPMSAFRAADGGLTCLSLLH